MSGKPGRGGRPRTAEPKRAYQAMLLLPEAEGFDEYVRRRAVEAGLAPDALGAGPVIRGLMLAAVKEAGIEIAEPAPAPSPPAPKKTPRRQTPAARGAS